MEDLFREFKDSLVSSGYTPEMAEAIAGEMTSALDGLARQKQEGK
jgi:hypothetical protein